MCNNPKKRKLADIMVKNKIRKKEEQEC